jgi:hypothetical protein
MEPKGGTLNSAVFGLGPKAGGPKMAQYSYKNFSV